MTRPNNYQIMADHARRLFLTYDQNTIISKSPVTADDDFIYLSVLGQFCRISRQTGYIFWSSPNGWQPSTLPGDALTIFDYLCDAKADRCLSGELKSMASFGHMFHTGLLESGGPSALEKRIDAHPDAFVTACTALGGIPFPNCDLGFTLPFFPDLPVTVQFWHSDEEFPPRLHYLWDSAATKYLRYETMYYALQLLSSRLESMMEKR